MIVFRTLAPRKSRGTSLSAYGALNNARYSCDGVSVRSVAAPVDVETKPKNQAQAAMAEATGTREAVNRDIAVDSDPLVACSCDSRLNLDVDKAAVDLWLEAYVDAWTSYDTDEIAALFADEVRYRYHPYDQPIVGRDAVVASWLGEGDFAGASTRDDPGTYTAGYHTIAVDGDHAVAIGTTSYRETPDGPVVKVYDNCFVMRFDDDGRCSEFTEWFVKRPLTARLAQHEPPD